MACLHDGAWADSCYRLKMMRMGVSAGIMKESTVGCGIGCERGTATATCGAERWTSSKEQT